MSLFGGRSDDRLFAELSGSDAGTRSAMDFFVRALEDDVASIEDADAREELADLVRKLRLRAAKRRVREAAGCPPPRPSTADLLVEDNRVDVEHRIAERHAKRAIERAEWERRLAEAEAARSCDPSCSCKCHRR